MPCCPSSFSIITSHHHLLLSFLFITSYHHFPSTLHWQVGNLAGYVSDNAAYHHGETSLAGTIVGMAQDFVGSNNINLLYPSGMFGTRRQVNHTLIPSGMFGNRRQVNHTLIPSGMFGNRRQVNHTLT
jgi:hypothetical protein